VSPRTGADLLVASLADQGVRCVCGIPGTQTVPLFEALRKSAIRTVLTTSELSAAFVAGAMGRLTGRPGVVLTIPGPGFTWALTGIAEALLDSAPLLWIAAGPPQVPGDRRFRQQELDQTALAGPLVKAVFEVQDAAEIESLTPAALRRCGEGEPGPVLLQIGQGVLGQAPLHGPAPAGSPPPPRGPDLAPLADRLRRARRPLLLFGQGAQRWADQAVALAERLNAPVLTTPSGRGVIPEDHPLALGFDGLAHAVGPANELIRRADLILVLGAKLGHNGTAGFGLDLPHDRLVHVDASPAVAGANYPASLVLVDSLETVLPALRSLDLARTEWSAAELAGWRSRIREARHPLVEPRVGGSEGQDARSFFASLQRALPRDAILVLDSGLHQILARRYCSVVAPGGLLFPSDLQSMGFGIPAAIGARLAAPDRPVVALVGDGGFGMTGFEIGTAVRERLDLVVLVYADGELGQIRRQQLADYGASYAVRLPALDLELVAWALGARYRPAGGDVGAAVAAALGEGGVTLIEVPVGDTLRLRAGAAATRVKRALAETAAGTWLRRLRSALRRA
jgi:acetolactate synthase-1/2/3 large subunit